MSPQCTDLMTPTLKDHNSLKKASLDLGSLQNTVTFLFFNLNNEGFHNKKKTKKIHVEYLSHLGTKEILYIPQNSVYYIVYTIHTCIHVQYAKKIISILVVLLKVQYPYYTHVEKVTYKEFDLYFAEANAIHSICNSNSDNLDETFCIKITT